MGIEGDKNTKDYYCGIFSYRPQWLRRFGATKYFVMIYSILAVLQGVEYSYKNATIQTLQRRFKINDQLTGIVFLANELSQIAFAVILGYVSVKGKSHRPHWIAVSVFLSAVACFLMTVPHFIYGNGEDGTFLALADGPGPGDMQIHTLQFTPRYLDSELNHLNNSVFHVPEGQMCRPNRVQRNVNINLDDNLYSFNSEDSGEESESEEETSEEVSEKPIPIPIINCNLDEASYLTIFFIVVSEALAGICTLLVYSLGSPYLEESLDKVNSAIIFGITMSFKIFGPLIGYQIANYCLQIFMTQAVSPGPLAGSLDDDHRIGAWWLGWLFVGAIMALVSLCMTLFPKYLPKAKKYRQVQNQIQNLQEPDEASTSTISSISSVSSISSSNQNSITSADSSISTCSSTLSSSNCNNNNTNNNNDTILPSVDYKDIKNDDLKANPQHPPNNHHHHQHHHHPNETFQDHLNKLARDFKLLLRNKINMFNNLSTLCYTFVATGYWYYMPNYIETIFIQSPEDASNISNIVGIVTQAIGLLGCGFLISKFQPSARFLAGWNVLIGFLYVVVKISFTQMHCKSGKFNFLSDFNADGGEDPLRINLEEGSNSCSSNCGCNNTDYAPWCDPSTRQVYFSACHAGCTSYFNGTFGNCSCLASGVELEKGICIEEGCNSNLLLFLAINGLLGFFEACGRIGNVLVSYRCVHPKKKGLAICFNVGLLCIFAYLPAPLLFGYIIDYACILWGTIMAENNRNCSSKGPCWLYDGEKLRYIYNLTAAAFLFIGTLFDGLVWYYVKDLDLYDDYKNIERWQRNKSNKTPQQGL